MNPFLLEPAALLADWKKLRSEMSGKPDLEQLQLLVAFWSQAPLMTIAYDPEVLDTYPSPWEMMNYNDWCGNSVAVGMEFTLRLAGWSPDRLRINLMRDYDASIQKLVVEVDGKYLLNYEYREISDIPNTRFDVLTVWKYSGRKYEKLS